MFLRGKMNPSFNWPKSLKIGLLVSAASAGLGLSLSAFAADSNSGQDPQLRSREERIRRNLEQGAFNINGGIFSKNTTEVPDELRLRNKSVEEVAAKLEELGVQYLFRFDQSDLVKENGRPYYSIIDFMGNGKAISKGGGKFKAQVCDLQSQKAELDNRLRNTEAEKDFPMSETESESFARFDRQSPIDPTGGYLLVQEADPTLSNLSADEGFTVGTWIKLKSDSKGQTATGYFPILSKSPLNQANAAGKFEWEFKTTGNVVYLIISRNGMTQNLNFNVPWWGDRFGNCYSGGIYRECWHYISVSLDPKVHKVSVLFMRKFSNKIPEPAAEDFHRYETSVKENLSPIQASKLTPLRIGGSNSNTMDGMLKGVFLSKKSMSAAEMKAMGLLTAPTREALTCSLND